MPDSMVSGVGFTGRLLEAYEYDPYGHHSVLSDRDQNGNLIFDPNHARDTSGVSPLGNPYRFTGRRFFSRTGLQ